VSIHQIRLRAVRGLGENGGVNIAAFVLFAAQASVGEQLRRVPKETWINLAVGILAIVILVRLWRGLRQINEYAPYIAAVFTGTVLFQAMVYYRNEPRFLTPLVEPLTAFFPTKARQDQALERMRQSRER
jgi:MFS superfamily sulfate permease-like transporter